MNMIFAEWHVTKLILSMSKKFQVKVENDRNDQSAYPRRADQALSMSLVGISLHTEGLFPVHQSPYLRLLKNTCYLFWLDTWVVNMPDKYSDLDAFLHICDKNQHLVCLLNYK